MSARYHFLTIGGYSRAFAQRTTLLVLGFLTILCLSACKDAKKMMDGSKEAYRAVEELAGQIKQATLSLKTNDFSQAKEFVAAAEKKLHTRTMSWAMQVLVTEEKEGVEAAKATIQKLRTTEGITDDELAALKEMDRYYEFKGRERTGDIVVMVAGVVVEQKYGKTALKAFLALCEKYRTAPGTVSTNLTSN